jgi:hypothetical protein
MYVLVMLYTEMKSWRMMDGWTDGKKRGRLAVVAVMCSIILRWLMVTNTSPPVVDPNRCI